MDYFPIYLPAVFIATLLVMVTSFWDFHLPYHPKKLRYAVSRRRYFLAASIYIGMHCILFLWLTGLMQALLIFVERFTRDLGLVDGLPQGIRQTSLVLSLLIIVVAPHLPVLRTFFAKIREFTHEIALYPKSIQLLLTLLAASRFKAHPDASRQLDSSLGRYLVPEGRLSTMISPNALRVLEEAWSLKTFFAGNGAKPMFYGFNQARAASLNKAELDLEKVLRRTAKIVLSVSAEDRSQLRAVSQFLAEDCEAVVAEYRTLLAEAVMSCIPGPGGREKLLAQFGYEVSLPPQLPYLSIVVIFALDWLLLLWPLILSPWILFNQPFPKFNVISFALAHAISLTAALAWAIFPKASYDFARPSLRGLPIWSYCLFGIASFISGCFVWTGLKFLIHPIPGMPMAEHPVLFISVNSITFLVITILASYLIDLRLRVQSYDYRRNRWRDGFALAFTVTAVAILTQAVLWNFIPPAFRLSSQTIVFLSLIFAIGFVVGFFVPSVSAVYLQADEMIADLIPSEADFLANLKRRKAVESQSVQTSAQTPAPS
ncbi:hypothetical protein AB7645_41155 [Bradyrhizobium sp. 956_D2_N1_5]|uniref:hypothetical protein n=1 Tax=unclassified Bradyrhizobium TaxID=2631580 RepID=UPI003F25A086